MARTPATPYSLGHDAYMQSCSRLDCPYSEARGETSAAAEWCRGYDEARASAQRGFARMFGG